MVPTVQSERLVLRPVESTDATALARAMRVPPALEGFPEGVRSGGEIAAWLEGARVRGTRVWTIAHSGEPIGLVTARFQYNAIVHLGFYVEEHRQGNGFTTEALRAAIQWIFNETPVHRIALQVTTSNVAMWRVAQRLGFVLEGVSRSNVRWAGTWNDARSYALLRNDWLSEVARLDRSGQRRYVPTNARVA